MFAPLLTAYSDWAEVIAAPATVDPMTTVVETPVSVTSASTGDSSATTDSTAPAQESRPLPMRTRPSLLRRATMPLQ
ncbi:MAG: hypothetical protein ACLU0O_01625 [Collinsella sp.]